MKQTVHLWHRHATLQVLSWWNEGCISRTRTFLRRPFHTAGVIFFSALALFAATTSRADYAIIADSFSSLNLTLPVSPQFGFTVHQGQLHSWNSDWGVMSANYTIVDLATNTLVYSSPYTTLDGNGYGDPFGIYDPTTATFYAGTYTYSGSGLWRFNSDDASWTKLGVFDSLYGAATYQGQIYASGLNQIWNNSSGQDNQIALYDLTGQNNHDVLIQATGNSATCAVDQFGNVYYANYGNLTGELNGLYVWSAAQIESVRADLGNGSAGGGEDDIYLTYSDGIFLTALPGGANGLTIDDAGNVFVSVNGDFSGIVMWNTLLGVGTVGDLDHYIEIGSIDGFWGWAGFLSAEGNVLDGGTLYAGSTMMGSDFSIITYSGDPITPPSINTLFVPEPSSALLLLAGAAWLFAERRKNIKKTKS